MPPGNQLPAAFLFADGPGHICGGRLARVRFGALRMADILAIRRGECVFR